jgi:di/tricarboxylate transporter
LPDDRHAWHAAVLADALAFSHKPVAADPQASLTQPVPARTAGDESRSKLGAFLVMSQFQGSVNSSAMFLTAAAQNLLCMKLATELGVVIPSPWLTWFKAAVLPAALGLLITPFLLYKASLWSQRCQAPHGCHPAMVLAVNLNCCYYTTPVSKHDTISL